MSSLISTLGIQKYELTLPSSKKTIEYRAFLVKEEKLLLMASESKNEKDMYKAMRDVVSACTFGNVDAEKAPLIDIEYVFLKVRSRSVGEKASPAIQCGSCKKTTQVEIDLSKVEPVAGEGHTPRIKIKDSVIVEMRYPQMKDLEEIQKVDGDFNKATSLVISCVDKIHTKEKVHHVSDYDRSEIEEFVYSMTSDQLKKLVGFMETMPKVKADVNFKCSSCGHEEVLSLNGVRDFF